MRGEPEPGGGPQGLWALLVELGPGPWGLGHTYTHNCTTHTDWVLSSMHRALGGSRATGAPDSSLLWAPHSQLTDCAGAGEELPARVPGHVVARRSVAAGGADAAVHVAAARAREAGAAHALVLLLRDIRETRDVE